MQALTQQFGQLSLGPGVRWQNQQYAQGQQPIASYQAAPAGYHGFYRNAQPTLTYQQNLQYAQQGHQRKSRRGGKRGTRSRKHKKQRKTRRN